MNKANLPTRTLIAFLWLIVMGVILTTWSCMLLFVAFVNSIGLDSMPAVPNLALYFFLPLYGIFTFLSFVFLSLESKKTWKITVIVLAITIICFLGLDLYSLVNDVYYMISLIALLDWLSCLIPLILIILDRKNYFEMVRQRKLENKGKLMTQSKVRG